MISLFFTNTKFLVAETKYQIFEKKKANKLWLQFDYDGFITMIAKWNKKKKLKVRVG